VHRDRQNAFCCESKDFIQLDRRSTVVASAELCGNEGPHIRTAK
jgi:hypothetical protein